MPPRDMENVPNSNVGEVVQSFVDEGYTNISCTRIGDNDWTVSARVDN